MKMHQKALDFFQEWYNFIKPHESLKEKIDSDRGKWLQKTPAINISNKTPAIKHQQWQKN